MLSVSDQEIEFFKNDVETYDKIDSQIKDLKKKMKPLQDKLKELTKIKLQKQDDVLNFMSCNDLDVCNIDTGSYELKNTKNTKQITKADVYDRLYKFFSEEWDSSQLKDMSNDEKAKFLHNYIYIEGRETVVGKTLKAK
jgi:hypothetical protein